MGRQVVDCPTQLFDIWMFICVSIQSLKDSAGQSARRQVDNFHDVNHDAEDDVDDQIDGSRARENTKNMQLAMAIHLQFLYTLFLVGNSINSIA